MANEQLKQIEDSKENQALKKELIRLKAWYFGSKYFSVKNWAIFEQVELPGGINAEELLDWEPEKQAWLAEDKINLQGVGEDFRKRLRDRLDTATAMKEKLIDIYGSIESAKDVNQATLALKKIAEIEDEVAKLLKLNSFEANIYEKNKTNVDKILKESTKKVTIL